MEKYFGKYRGTVVNNIDPKMMGRLILMVPDVLDLVPTTWAEPCTPLAGPTGTPMGTFLVPPIGAAVWVEFEQGNPNYPIWVGCRWGGSSDVPPLALAGLPTSPNIVLQTMTQHAFVMSDGPMGIMLKSRSGAFIMINDTGIIIDNGVGANITMTANTVIINKGNLTVL